MRVGPAEGGWGSWESQEEEQLARWASLSYGERLAWLEQVKAFATLARGAGRVRNAASDPGPPSPNDGEVGGPDPARGDG